MEIELIDIIIILIPIMLLNIYFSLKNSITRKIFSSKIPFLLVSYSILITTPIFIFLVIFHIHIGHTIVFHIHNFQSEVIADVMSFEIDSIAILILGWSFSIIYSAFLISQFALWLLFKYLDKFEVKGVDSLKDLPEVTLSLLRKKNVTIKVISNSDFGSIFAMSYYHFLYRKNFIFINESLLKFFTIEEFNAALTHEIGHIFNLDTVFFPLFNTLNKVMFFDPFLKKLNIKYRDKMENKADTYAINNIKKPIFLAKAIVKNVEFELDNSSVKSLKDQNSFIIQMKSSSKDKLMQRIERIKKSDVSQIN